MTVPASVSMLYALMSVGVMGFQIALILGAPWGHLTQGGQTVGALKPTGRMAAAGSVLILMGMAGGILSAGGLWPHWPAWTGWTALAVQTLSTLANWITSSKPERRLWGPITLVLLILAAVAIIWP